MNLLFDHFDKLAEAPGGVKKLRDLILQLAVQGKLVPQDPNEEPATVLLEMIQAEKERLVKEGKIKKQKPLDPIKDSEIPFEVPEGWVWAKVNDLGFVLGGKRLPKGCDYSHSVTPYRYLTVTNMKDGTIIDDWPDDFVFVDEVGEPQRRLGNFYKNA